MQFVQNVRERNFGRRFKVRNENTVPNLRKHQQLQCYHRTDEVVLTRFRIGHSRLTHTFVLKHEPPPERFRSSTSYTNAYTFRMCRFFGHTQVVLQLQCHSEERNNT